MTLLEALAILTGKSQRQAKERNKEAYQELMKTIEHAEGRERALIALRNINKILKGDKPNGMA